MSVTALMGLCCRGHASVSKCSSRAGGDVSFHVKRGRTVAFVGATGAGKTSINGRVWILNHPEQDPRREALLTYLSTPDKEPWSARRIPVVDQDPRDPYNRDRDRVLHSVAFHKLQYKTQVYLIHEGDFYRTRLTHTLEVAQISRTMARLLGLSEPLAEAIALAHDLGHSPFGHAGEEALDQCLRRYGDERGWDSNRHSLLVVDELELVYPDAPGLNLTYATRQGIARHETPFDRPARDFDECLQPIPEAQVVNLADIIAYAGHDIQDAIEVGLLSPETIAGEDSLSLWHECWEMAVLEFDRSHRAESLSREDKRRLLITRARRHLIDKTIKEAVRYSTDLARSHNLKVHEDVINWGIPVISLPATLQDGILKMVKYLFENVYSSPLVERQNEKERWIMTSLFDRLMENHRLLSEGAQLRLKGLSNPKDIAREVAIYLASLTDRGALDLYAELFDPRDRMLGHHFA